MNKQKRMLKLSSNDWEELKPFLDDLGVDYTGKFDFRVFIAKMDFRRVMNANYLSEHKKLVFLDICLQYFGLKAVFRKEGICLEYANVDDDESTLKASKAINFIAEELIEEKKEEIKE